MANDDGLRVLENLSLDERGFRLTPARIAEARAQLGSLTPEDEAEAAKRLGCSAYREAWEWISDNERAWEWMLEKMAEDASDGMRISVAHLWECLRQKDWTAKSGASFRLNNTKKAALIRIALALHPEWRRLVELRSSFCDMADPMEHAPRRWRNL